jgi:hypothetical protein
MEREESKDRKAWKRRSSSISLNFCDRRGIKAHHLTIFRCRICFCQMELMVMSRISFSIIEVLSMVMWFIECLEWVVPRQPSLPPTTTQAHTPPPPAFLPSRTSNGDTGTLGKGFGHNSSSPPLPPETEITEWFTKIPPAHAVEEEVDGEVCVEEEVGPLLSLKSYHWDWRAPNFFLEYKNRRRWAWRGSCALFHY